MNNLYLIFILIFLLFIFILTVLLKILDFKASLLSLIIGLEIYFLSNIYFLILLIIFVFISYIFSKFKVEYKNDDVIRSYKSVISKGLVPAIVVLLPMKIITKETIFSVSVAAALADTLAGEIGILSKNTYNIINLKKVKTGENGGISIIGELSSLFGSFIISIFAYIFFKLSLYNFLIIFIFGFISSNLDSLLGALLENRNLMNKHEVNLFSITLSSFFAYLLI
ncbi:MAG: DUF92 domain-containing protein [Thermoplasmata archaeon]